MSEATSIIVRDDLTAQIAFTPEAEAMKEQALSCASLIGKVANGEDQEKAVAAQVELKKFISQVEKAEEAAKKPLNDFKGRIISKAREFRQETVDELLRIGLLVSDFQTLEAAKLRAAEAAARNEISDLEKQKQDALAKAKSHEELDSIQEHYSNLARDVAAGIPQPARAEGQVVGSDWQITVEDIYMLAKCHPNCVRIEPRLSEIKELLALGIQVRGIKAERVTKASVRLTPERKAIEV